MELVVAPVFQEYVAAPLAVNVAVLPLHIVDEFMITDGIGFTVTDDVTAFEQPDVVPITV